MLLPGLILSGMFVFYPIFAAVFYAMQDWSGFNADIKFVGFQNFVDLFRDPIFWNAFGRSIYFLAGTVPAQLVLSLMLAMVLNNQLLKLSNLFRTMVFLPVVTPVAVIGIVWTFLLSPFNGPISTAKHAPASRLPSSSTSLTAPWKRLRTCLLYTSDAADD